MANGGFQNFPFHPVYVCVLCLGGGGFSLFRAFFFLFSCFPAAAPDADASFHFLCVDFLFGVLVGCGGVVEEEGVLYLSNYSI